MDGKHRRKAKGRNEGKEGNGKEGKKETYKTKETNDNKGGNGEGKEGNGRKEGKERREDVVGETETLEGVERGRNKKGRGETSLKKGWKRMQRMKIAERNRRNERKEGNIR
jgi:hypothetical protein